MKDEAMLVKHLVKISAFLLRQSRLENRYASVQKSANRKGFRTVCSNCLPCFMC